MKRSLVVVTATLVAVALAGFVVSPAFGGPGFLTLTRAKKVFVTKASARAYLTKAEAASSYLGKGEAGSTYVSKAEAGSTYLTKGEAGTTYVGKADAEKTYVGKAEADAKYLPASATSTIQVSPANWVSGSAQGSVTYAINATVLAGTSGEPTFIAGTSVPSELQGRAVKLAGVELCASGVFPATITLILVALGNKPVVIDETAHTGAGCYSEKPATPLEIGLNPIQVGLRASFNGNTISVERLSLQLTD